MRVEEVGPVDVLGPLVTYAGQAGPGPQDAVRQVAAAREVGRLAFQATA